MRRSCHRLSRRSGRCKCPSTVSIQAKACRPILGINGLRSIMRRATPPTTTMRRSPKARAGSKSATATRSAIATPIRANSTFPMQAGSGPPSIFTRLPIRMRRASCSFMADTGKGIRVSSSLALPKVRRRPDGRSPCLAIRSRRKKAFRASSPRSGRRSTGWPETVPDTALLDRWSSPDGRPAHNSPHCILGIPASLPGLQFPEFTISLPCATPSSIRRSICPTRRLPRSRRCAVR